MHSTMSLLVPGQFFFKKFLGGISDIILWTVILLISLYLLYLQFEPPPPRYFHRSAETVKFNTDDKSTHDVSVDSSFDFTEHDIPSNFDKITGVSTQKSTKVTTDVLVQRQSMKIVHIVIKA